MQMASLVAANGKFDIKNDQHVPAGDRQEMLVSGRVVNYFDSAAAMWGAAEFGVSDVGSLWISKYSVIV